MNDNKVQCIDDLDFEEKAYVAMKRRGMTNRDVAYALDVSISLVAQTRKRPRKSSTVRKYLESIIKRTGLSE